ncbi:docking protein 2 [Latimeria chalumnae]|uniref:docking protein 2 n=1 Tax=Latimeria chalumnae TaxID=7897 RepID=UPI00313CD169
MEESVIKQGILYFQQQQTFGKKWRKAWAILYRESTCSIARLEYYEGTNFPEKEKNLKKPENKKVIKLSDCIRVGEVMGENCPKDTATFLVETTEKLFIFAAQGSDCDNWVKSLCEVTFPMSRSEHTMGIKKDNQRSLKSKSARVAMEENSLYSTREPALKDFKVAVRRTEASERCRLRGSFILKAADDCLALKDMKSGETLYTWPYRFLRRFGRDKMTFSFESGRRCASGEGNFEFETKQGNEIFHTIESAISVHKTTLKDEKRYSPPSEETMLGSRFQVPDGTTNQVPLEEQFGEEQSQRSAKSKGDISSAFHHSSSVRCLSLESSWDAKSTSKSRAVKNLHSCPLPSTKAQPVIDTKGNFLQVPGLETPYLETPVVISQNEEEESSKSLSKHKKKHAQQKESQQESEYAVPFDAVAKSLMASTFGTFPFSRQEVDNEISSFLLKNQSGIPDPLYDSIDEMTIKGRECSALPAYFPVEHIYDEPEGISVSGVYDEPEVVKGHAWKFQATEQDPSGHEYPYNPHVDDYAVPRKIDFQQMEDFGIEYEEEDITKESEYDNVVLKILEKKNVV